MSESLDGAGSGLKGMLTSPVAIQRVEGGVLLVLSVLLYWKTSGPWWLFLVLVLVPDLSMLGYLSGPRLGAVLYNLGHTWLFPGCLAVAGLLGGPSLLIELAIIWFAHIGMDRLFGYGLKLPTAFQDTHLGRIGRHR